MIITCLCPPCLLTFSASCVPRMLLVLNPAFLRDGHIDGHGKYCPQEYGDRGYLAKSLAIHSPLVLLPIVLVVIINKHAISLFIFLSPTLQYFLGSHYSSGGTWYQKHWVSGVNIFTWYQNHWVSGFTINNNKKRHTWYQKHWVSGVLIFTWYQNHWVSGFTINNN